MDLVRRAILLFVVMAVLLPGSGAQALAVRAFRASGYEATIRELPPKLRERMTGSSWRPGCPVPLDKLRLVRLTYRGFDRERHFGRLVVHRSVASEIVQVFQAVYDAGFPIRRMRLIDAYGADDIRSMEADNTSAFNCRYRNGVCCTWSMHAYGKAIDINPVENPYVGAWGVSPDPGEPYVDRTPIRRGMIEHGDAIWRAFRAIDWLWGGDWTWPIDYQHFSRNGR